MKYGEVMNVLCRLHCSRQSILMIFGTFVVLDLIVNK